MSHFPFLAAASIRPIHHCIQRLHPRQSIGRPPLSEGSRHLCTLLSRCGSALVDMLDAFVCTIYVRSAILPNLGRLLSRSAYRIALDRSTEPIITQRRYGGGMGVDELPSPPSHRLRMERSSRQWKAFGSEGKEMVEREA
ncbi:hypothetical protein BV22DRAFT_1133703 [Leucogyrophana mollusca]|uniref:Uncharacterized protein n=1 Tax=Leucogyrophana mollusca TaxID=85980 RepID=A0ACB8B1A9_9AGAM|nr:hypothetical protein BV22DRAFT_1133703 [Leucogyrophana mollusca]